MSLIHMSQIDWGEGRLSDLEDPNHRHIFLYADHPDHFATEPYLPYYGDCPTCKEISELNKKWVEERGL